MKQSNRQQAEGNLTERLRKGDQSVFECIYEEYREAFLSWAEDHYALSRETLLDTFQEAVASLYINTLKGKYDPNQSSIKTYLFSIGKNYIFDYLSQKDKQPDKSEYQDELPDDEKHFCTYQDGSSGDQEKVDMLLENLSKGYRNLLKLYYIEGCSMQEIANRLGYRNKDAVKATKYRCLCYIKDCLS